MNSAPGTDLNKKKKRGENAQTWTQKHRSKLYLNIRLIKIIFTNLFNLFFLLFLASLHDN